MYLFKLFFCFYQLFPKATYTVTFTPLAQLNQVPSLPAARLQTLGGLEPGTRCWQADAVCSFPSRWALPEQQQLHGLHVIGDGQQRLQPGLLPEGLRPARALQQAGPGEVHRRLPAAGGTVESESESERFYCQVHLRYIT